MAAEVQIVKRPRKGLPTAEAQAVREHLGALVAKLGAELDRDSSSAGNETIQPDQDLTRLGRAIIASATKLVRASTEEYVSVVRSYKDPKTGRWRKKTLQSFGRNTPEAQIRAELYRSSYNAALEKTKAIRLDKFASSAEHHETKAAIERTFGSILGSRGLTDIFDAVDSSA